MKLVDFKMEEWDGKYSIIHEDNIIKILLLNLKNISGLKKDGRKNIVCVDNHMNIIWIVSAPKLAREFGYFWGVKFEENKIVGWYGGSNWVQIDINNGNIITEEFVK